MLVDKKENNKKEEMKDHKSIFSIGDYRHNIALKHEADLYSSKVNQLPKQFLSWDDGTKFNPKYKKDK